MTETNVYSEDSARHTKLAEVLLFLINVPQVDNGRDLAPPVHTSIQTVQALEEDNVRVIRGRDAPALPPPHAIPT
jgi:hypothetical protein